VEGLEKKRASVGAKSYGTLYVSSQKRNSEMRVIVLIPMHNHADYTDKCIAEVQKNAGTEDYRILVVDDFSSAPYSCDAATVIRTPRNLGFTGAVNYGLRHLKLNYDYVLILNNDTEPYPDFLKELLITAEKEEQAGIVGACRVSSREPFTMQTWQADILSGKTWAQTEELKEDVQCLQLAFCCVLLKKSLIEDVGLLDERMVNHCSDNDYCFKATFGGYGIVLCAKSKVFHHQSLTVNSLNLEPYEDQKTFVRKWFGVAMNELLERIPLNYDLNKYGAIGFAYDVKREGEKIVCA
jgi:GT2 family glycosyltransferase